MAKDVKPTTDNANAGAASADPPKKSKKLLIILSLLFVLILGVGLAGVYWLFFTGNGEEEEVAQEVQKPAKKKAKESAPVYVALEPFTVNLIPEQTDQFLQLVLSVEVEDVVAGDRVKMYTPKIRNNVMLLLSSKKASELLTKEGKEALAHEIRGLMNDVLSPGHEENDGPVKDVLFTSFIIQ